MLVKMNFVFTWLFVKVSLNKYTMIHLTYTLEVYGERE